MKIIGIIAEYNPFHNGHAYQINEIKKRTGADYVVIALSGDFVQRGTPAIIDKYARTKMALCSGADLILELPALWATASAEDFAMAGVTLFDKMGCVDTLCFGAETDNLPLLSTLAEILADEPAKYQSLLSAYLKEGLVFPAARAKALCELLNDEGISSILNEPNNILALEYLKALKRRNSSIQPYLLKREGASYHDTEIATDTSAPAASATAIREVLLDADTNFILQAKSASDFQPGDSSALSAIAPSAFQSRIHNCEINEILNQSMPDTATDILLDYLHSRPLIQSDDFSSILGYQLLNVSKEILALVGGCNTDIANRLFKNRTQFSSFETFCELNKSKDTTYARISRILLHLILGISHEDYQRARDFDYIPYLRILGFRMDASALLKILKASANVPLISKLADASSFLSKDALWLLEKDIFAADLYEQLCSVELYEAHKKKTTSQNEYTREIVRI